MQTRPGQAVGMVGVVQAILVIDPVRSGSKSPKYSAILILLVSVCFLSLFSNTAMS